MAVKYIVEVYLPAAQKTFDLRIPASSRIGEINVLSAALCAELSGGSFAATRQSALLDAKSGKILDVNMTAEEQGIRNGSRLILI